MAYFVYHPYGVEETGFVFWAFQDPRYLAQSHQPLSDVGPGALAAEETAVAADGV